MLSRRQLGILREKTEKFQNLEHTLSRLTEDLQNRTVSEFPHLIEDYNQSIARTEQEIETVLREIEAILPWTPGETSQRC